MEEYSYGEVGFNTRALTNRVNLYKPITAKSVAVKRYYCLNEFTGM